MRAGRHVACDELNFPDCDLTTCGNRDDAIDRASEDETTVVIDVVAQQFQAAWRFADDDWIPG